MISFESSQYLEVSDFQRGQTLLFRDASQSWHTVRLLGSGVGIWYIEG